MCIINNTNNTKKHLILYEVIPFLNNSSEQNSIEVTLLKIHF